MKNFEWHSGYEFTVPNAVDRAFEERMLGRERGKPALLICRSPFLDEDLAKTPRGIQCVIGVNHAILKHSAIIDYNLGGDEAYWQDVDPRAYPKTLFVTGFVQNLKTRWFNWNRPDNVVCYTSPPHLPPGHSEPTRDIPRPRCCAHTFSSIAGLWLAWYMGCPSIYVAGCHCKMRDGELYGDVPAKQLGRTDSQIANYEHFMPFLAENFVKAVERMREVGMEINWPGETVAREVAHAQSLY